MPPQQPSHPKRTPQEQDHRDHVIPRPATESGLIAVSQTLWLPVWHKVAATPPVKVVGYQLLEFADFGDGADIRPGEIVLASRTSQTDRTVGKALTQIRAWGLIWRYREGSRHGRQQLSDEYRLTIPADLLVRVPFAGTISQDLLKRLGFARPSRPSPRSSERRSGDRSRTGEPCSGETAGSPEPHDRITRTSRHGSPELRSPHLSHRPSPRPLSRTARPSRPARHRRAGRDEERDRASPRDARGQSWRAIRHGSPAERDP